jgi:hypothetical protein
MNGLTLLQPIKPAYPINAFHLVVCESACEVLEHTKAPDVLVGMAFIHGLTLSCQGLIDVKLPTGQVKSVSQNMLIIAESGERKTTVYDLVLKSVIDADNEAILMYRSRLEQFKIEDELWNAAFKGITRAISKAISRGESTTELEQQLSEHGKLKPKKPRLLCYLRQDMTSKAIMEALHGDGESIAISIDEGHVYFKSAASSSFGLLNRLWDSSESLSLNRADLEFLFAKHPRGSVCIMTQSAPFKKYLERHGTVARGSGHWARYLVAWPQSTQGYRSVKPSEQVWRYLPKFHARVSELLEKYRIMNESGNVEREIIEFSEEAKARWYELAAQAESMLRPGEYLSDINDFASKIMEIIARLAAAMHYFNGEAGKITYDTLERAFTLVRWHIDEFKYLFSSQSVMSQDLVDTREVLKCLRNRIWKGYGSNSFVPKNLLLRNGPVRNRDRLNIALDNLVAQSAIWIGQTPKNKQLYVNLNDAYFGSIPVLS